MKLNSKYIERVASLTKRIREEVNVDIDLKVYKNSNDLACVEYTHKNLEGSMLIENVPDSIFEEMLDEFIEDCKLAKSGEL